MERERIEGNAQNCGDMQQWKLVHNFVVCLHPDLQCDWLEHIKHFRNISGVSRFLKFDSKGYNDHLHLCKCHHPQDENLTN